MNIFDGSCACGKIKFRLKTEVAADEFSARCDRESCEFCRKNDGVWISDPAGVLEILGVEGLKKYRFGHKTADFCSCGECGTLCFALFEWEGRTFSVARIGVFDEILFDPARMISTDFSVENAENRLARRAKNWTPVEFL